MINELDNYQNKLLELIKNNELEWLTLDQIKDKIWIPYIQWVVNKLKQLEKKGYIRKNEDWTYILLEERINDIFNFPLIWFAQCGNISNNDIYDITYYEKIPFSTKLLWLNSIKDLDKYFFIKAKGDSMKPLINDWYFLLVKKEIEYNSENDMLLVIHNDIPKVKKIKKSNKWNFLVSINKDYNDFEILEEDEVIIVWIIKKIISNY